MYFRLKSLRTGSQTLPCPCFLCSCVNKRRQNVIYSKIYVLMHLRIYSKVVSHWGSTLVNYINDKKMHTTFASILKSFLVPFQCICGRHIYLLWNDDLSFRTRRAKKPFRGCHSDWFWNEVLFHLLVEHGFFNVASDSKAFTRLFQM